MMNEGNYIISQSKNNLRWFIKMTSFVKGSTKNNEYKRYVIGSYFNCDYNLKTEQSFL